MWGTAAAASLRSTVMRTSSEPARASAATWRTVASTSAVSVLVIDCTTTGAPPPTVTSPTLTWVVLCLAKGAATSFIAVSLKSLVISRRSVQTTGAYLGWISPILTP